MKKSTKDALWGVTALLLVLVGCGVAGHFDYQDAVVSEMKNCGAYWELAEQHPQASDAELIELYQREGEIEEH